MSSEQNRLDELNGRTSALSLVVGRVKRLAMESSVADGAAMYRILTAIVEPMRLQCAESAMEEREALEAKAKEAREAFEAEAALPCNHSILRRATTFDSNGVRFVYICATDSHPACHVTFKAKETK